MRALSKIFWLLAFLVATFLWMVVFEHGFSAKAITDGSQKEWKRLVESVSRAVKLSPSSNDDNEGTAPP